MQTIRNEIRQELQKEMDLKMNEMMKQLLDVIGQKKKHGTKQWIWSQS